MAHCKRCKKFMLFTSDSGYCKTCEEIVSKEEAYRKKEEERNLHEEEKKRQEEERRRAEEEQIEQGSGEKSNIQLTEEVRKWFFEEPSRIAMVQIVHRIHKSMGGMTTEEELAVIIDKLRKETYFANIIPYDRVEDVDFESIARLFMD